MEFTLRLKNDDVMNLNKCQKLVQEKTATKAIRNVLYLYPIEVREGRARERRIDELEQEIEKLNNILDQIKTTHELISDL